MLVAPDDPPALADALVRVLSDRALTEQLSAGARGAAAPWLQTPEEYALFAAENGRAYPISGMHLPNFA